VWTAAPPFTKVARTRGLKKFGTDPVRYTRSTPSRPATSGTDASRRWTLCVMYANPTCTSISVGLARNWVSAVSPATSTVRFVAPDAVAVARPDASTATSPGSSGVHAGGAHAGSRS
jgi:hypothetical protein